MHLAIEILHLIGSWVLCEELWSKVSCRNRKIQISKRTNQANFQQGMTLINDDCHQQQLMSSTAEKHDFASFKFNSVKKISTAGT